METLLISTIPAPNWHRGFGPRVCRADGALVGECPSAPALFFTMSDGRHAAATAGNALQCERACSRKSCGLTGEPLMREWRAKKTAGRSLVQGSALLCSIAADCGTAPEEEVAARHEPPHAQRTAAQSPTRFGTTTSRLDPPGPGGSEWRPQVLVSGLQPPAVAQTN